MKPVIEIRIHGRGGQGNVAAAELLALAAFAGGYEVQAFPAFGAERMGSPVQAFVRLSHQPIRIRSQVYEPDIVVVQDPGLSRTAGVQDGLKPGGTLILNTISEPVFSPKDSSTRVFALPATRIANEIIGRPIPNAVMLGAFAAATRLIHMEGLEIALAERFEGELAKRNVDAAMAGAAQVREIQVPGRPVPTQRIDTAPALTDVVEPGSSRGYLTASWRTSRPMFKHDRCNGCDLCAVYCPEGIITAEGKTFYAADYDFCKGCGICAEECPVDDILMVAEDVA